MPTRACDKSQQFGHALVVLVRARAPRSQEKRKFTRPMIRSSEFLQLETLA